MLTLISFVFHYWFLLVILGGFAVAAAWWSGLVAVKDLAKKVIAFAQTKPGIGVLCLCAGLWIGIKVGDNDLAVERERSHAAAVQADLDITKDAKALAERKAAKLAADATSNEGRIKQLEEDLLEARNKPPADPKVIVRTKVVHDLKSCPAGNEAIKRLMEIK